MSSIYKERKEKRCNMNFLRSGTAFMLLLLLGVWPNVSTGADVKEYGGGPIVFIRPVRAVIFEHRFHLGQKFDCQICHPVLFSKKTGTVEQEEDFTMASFRQGKYCGKCHDGRVAFSVDTKCNWCHIGVQGYKHLEEYELELK